MFEVQNITLFRSNLDSCTIVTRQKQNLYFPQANLTIYQKGVYFAGIKVFNKLPIEIKNTSSNLSKFKSALKHFLSTLILHYRRILKVIIMCAILVLSFVCLVVKCFCVLYCCIIDLFYILWIS
jgi:hypothetical protein